MKNFKIFTRLFLLVMLVAAPFTSCKDDDDDELSATYVGTWVRESPASEILPFASRDVFVLTQNGFTGKTQIKQTVGTTSTYIDYAKFEGTMTVTDSKMTVTLKSIGIAFNPETLLPTFTMVNYSAGTPMFNAMMAEGFDYDVINYSISGNTLTLKLDVNKNGVFGEVAEDEVEVFTRQ